MLGSKSGNAKSVVGWMALEIGYGDQIFFRAQGPDAEKAVNELAELVQDLREAGEAPKAKPAAKATSTDPNTLGGVGISPGLQLVEFTKCEARVLRSPKTPRKTFLSRNRRSLKPFPPHRPSSQRLCRKLNPKPMHHLCRAPRVDRGSRPPQNVNGFNRPGLDGRLRVVTID